MDTQREQQEQQLASTGCCPRFDPKPWEGRELIWRDKPFLREHVRTFFHVPIGMGGKMKRVQQQIEAAHAEPPQPLMLADDSSPWHTELYIDISGPVPDAEIETLSGDFMTRVFDGPYRDAPKWAAEMQRWVAAEGRKLEKLYFGYTSCPACAKAYGHNYVVMFAKVGPAPA